jgi:hypothetical protein
MLKRILTISMAMNTLLLPNAWAIDQMWATDQSDTRQEAREQETIYGSQLMTDQERTEYREKIRTAASEDEREVIRRQHHQLMQERARTQGITLPESSDDREHEGHDH